MEMSRTLPRRRRLFFGYAGRCAKGTSDKLIEVPLTHVMGYSPPDDVTFIFVPAIILFWLSLFFPARYINARNLSYLVIFGIDPFF
jgi:hypothetical protein